MDCLPAADEVDALGRRVDADDNVQGVLLTGSYAHGMATPDCDIDLQVILAERDERWMSGPFGPLDVHVVDADGFRRVPVHPANWWDRYRIGRGRLLLDRTDGSLAADHRRWSALSAVEQADAVDYYLDPYLTYTMRSLHEARHGEAQASRLDAAEAIPWALRLVFAIRGRVRPTNRYLAWELEHHPLDVPGLSGSRLSALLEDMLADGSPAAQRELFADLEPRLRAQGFGGALEGYPKAMQLLHAG